MCLIHFESDPMWQKWNGREGGRKNGTKRQSEWTVERSVDGREGPRSLGNRVTELPSQLCLAQVTSARWVSVSSSLVRRQRPRFQLNILWSLKYPLRFTFGEVVLPLDKKPSASVWSSEQSTRIKSQGHNAAWRSKPHIIHHGSCYAKGTWGGKWVKITEGNCWVSDFNLWAGSGSHTLCHCGLKENCEENQQLIPTSHFSWISEQHKKTQETLIHSNLNLPQSWCEKV